MTHTFDLNDEHIEELKMLQKAMQKYAMENGDTKEEAEAYYDLQRVFDFVMELGQNYMILRQIENVGYNYDSYYDDYPYEFGTDRTKEMMKIEEETGEIVSHAYPNPRIKRS